MDPLPRRSSVAFRSRRSNALVITFHELLPALAAVAGILDGEKVPVLSFEPERIAPFSLRRGIAQDQGVAVPRAVRGNGRREAHAVEPVPDDVVRLRIPAEHVVSLEHGLAVLLLDVVGHHEKAVQLDLAGEPGHRRTARTPRGRAQLLLADPVPGESVQLSMVLRGLRHLVHGWPPRDGLDRVSETPPKEGGAMRGDIVPGATFPDYELPDQGGRKRKLSELQGDAPLILVLARGNYCPKERRQGLELSRFHPEIKVGYARIVTITTDDQLATNENRDGLGAQWPFLFDPGRIVQKDLDIQEYTDPLHDPMIPHTLVLEPGLVIHSIYNGYWFWGRPSAEDLRRDLRAVTRAIRPDWDLSAPGLREAWDSGDDLAPFHGWSKWSPERIAAARAQVAT